MTRAIRLATMFAFVAGNLWLNKLSLRNMRSLCSPLAPSFVSLLQDASRETLMPFFDSSLSSLPLAR